MLSWQHTHTYTINKWRRPPTLGAQSVKFPLSPSLKSLFAAATLGAFLFHHSSLTKCEMSTLSQYWCDLRLLVGWMERKRTLGGNLDARGGGQAFKKKNQSAPPQSTQIWIFNFGLDRRKSFRFEVNYIELKTWILKGDKEFIFKLNTISGSFRWKFFFFFVKMIDRLTFPLMSAICFNKLRFKWQIKIVMSLNDFFSSLK